VVVGVGEVVDEGTTGDGRRHALRRFCSKGRRGGAGLRPRPFSSCSGA